MSGPPIRKKSPKQKLERLIIEHCYWYYVKSQPRISDHEFDMLFKKLQKLEESLGTHPKSPTQMIYGDVADQYPAWILESESKATVMDPVFSAQSLIEQVYGILLCTHIWTRKDNSWYDPEYPGYSEKVDRVLVKFEETFIKSEETQ